MLSLLDSKATPRALSEGDEVAIHLLVVLSDPAFGLESLRLGKDVLVKVHCVDGHANRSLVFISLCQFTSSGKISRALRNLLR